MQHRPHAEIHDSRGPHPPSDEASWLLHCMEESDEATSLGRLGAKSGQAWGTEACCRIQGCRSMVLMDGRFLGVLWSASLMKERAPSVIHAGKAGLRDRMCSYVSALCTTVQKLPFISSRSGGNVSLNFS